MKTTKKSMTLKGLLQSPIVRLPKGQDASSSMSFRKFLFDLLDEYLIKIDSLKLTKSIKVYSVKAEKQRVENLVKGIKAAVEAYLNGFPQKAYLEMEDAFKNSRILADLPISKFPAKTSFYRLRKDETNYALKRGELFHIPFQKRGVVSTMRYSIPGFPCLYISDSVYVAWEEMRRPSLANIQAVRLENTSEIKLMNLTTDIYMGMDSEIDKLSPQEQWKHIFAWPLLAACSIKVLDDGAQFKPEYIVPQILLQITRGDDNLSGVMFSSTRIDRNEMSIQGSFLNFAIPVKKNHDSGHCPDLLKLFYSTSPVPWEISDVFSGITGAFIGAASSPKISHSVKSIQLIDKKTIAYQYSVFGKLEEELLRLKTFPINS